MGQESLLSSVSSLSLDLSHFFYLHLIMSDSSLSIEFEENANSGAQDWHMNPAFVRIWLERYNSNNAPPEIKLGNGTVLKPSEFKQIAQDILKVHKDSIRSTAKRLCRNLDDS